MNGGREGGEGGEGGEGKAGRGGGGGQGAAVLVVVIVCGGAEWRGFVVVEKRCRREVLSQLRRAALHLGKFSLVIYIIR